MTPTQLKAKVKNISREKEVNPQLVLRHFMMEKFLEKISESPYRENFVLKGGFLIGSKYGIENRTTKDIDTTLREMKVTKETLTTVLNEIFSTPTKEGIQFEIQGMKETREADYYPGFSLRVLAHLENMRPDLTTGDSIYPATITHSHKLMFEDRTIPLESYPTEQIIAEKLSATFDFLTDNSRGKDFYDLYTIPKMEKIDEKTLKDSVRNTFTRRGKTDPLKIYYEKDMDVLKNSHELKDTWKKYQKSNPYAASITYDETMDSISNLMEKVIHVEEKERKLAYQRHQQMNREMER
ncbi:nucleotidyl transferase AbiEii/AbiGii toxin family protein [Enterococcus durans]|uniref:nucleotidyl transferase AbiEii/AbiGii toxin family protein n=1 Tax=Enterococcus TaxID=1350 RepID=UPI00103AA858|nr:MULTISPECIES: nucleotidyl transferase AbiEii/AbiGii toxin family protein [Enterococcus]MBM1153892.1 nucleotidyl transferase AbiEii/AbiGii toxin family protein [Enterococcus durans]MBT9717236.1 nucleotidyl transferase AbiEii/AbiGii toxin family protein [Enterococcus durans]MCM6879834.1 nucleotidyl transferase AbiEii/AbiGii toxin family protein [Enterococcus faecium]TBX29759.1 nucleotidyl transferase AbiEii/AbiGii toxin family protein [Enterococcus durans]